MLAWLRQRLDADDRTHGESGRRPPSSAITMRSRCSTAGKLQDGCQIDDRASRFPVGSSRRGPQSEAPGTGVISPMSATSSTSVTDNA